MSFSSCPPRPDQRSIRNKERKKRDKVLIKPLYRYCDASKSGCCRQTTRSRNPFSGNNYSDAKTPDSDGFIFLDPGLGRLGSLAVCCGQGQKLRCLSQPNLVDLAWASSPPVVGPLGSKVALLLPARFLARCPVLQVFWRRPAALVCLDCPSVMQTRIDQSAESETERQTPKGRWKGELAGSWGPALSLTFFGSRSLRREGLCV